MKAWRSETSNDNGESDRIGDFFTECAKTFPQGIIQTIKGCIRRSGGQQDDLQDRVLSLAQVIRL